MHASTVIKCIAPLAFNQFYLATAKLLIKNILLAWNQNHKKHQSEPLVLVWWFSGAKCSSTLSSRKDTDTGLVAFQSSG